MAEETKLAWAPCLPPPMPPRARLHCRHYDYAPARGGPSCAVGVDNAAATAPCMPLEFIRGATCEKREEWTAEERAAWEAWADEHMRRTIVVLTAIPSDMASGVLDPCPGCGEGTVRWARAGRKRHLHAHCTTPNCFSVMQ